MEPLTEAQWTKLFQDCQRSAWHLETHDLYGVDDEKGRFAQFLATGQRDQVAEASDRRHWLDLMRATTAAGRQVRRARLVSEPLNDYMRFCYLGSQLNIDAGEDIRWLPRAHASRVPLPGNDFWLFDGTTVLASGCFDFAVSEENGPMFLECNPNGQWAWLEAETGQPIAAGFADLLEGN
jgi:hypothetical protein